MVRNVSEIGMFRFQIVEWNEALIDHSFLIMSKKRSFQLSEK